MANTTGGCLCGAIKYAITGEPLKVANCHCSSCKKVTGAAFATSAFFMSEQIVVTLGAPRTFEHLADSGNRVTMEFCEHCGSQIFGSGELRPGIKGVKVGSLDDPSSIMPTANLYVARALRYSHIDPALENFEQMPSI